MFFLLSFLSDTLDILEEVFNQLRRKRKEDDNSPSTKRKPPPDFMNKGL